MKKKKQPYQLLEKKNISIIYSAYLLYDFHNLREYTFFFLLRYFFLFCFEKSAYNTTNINDFFVLFRIKKKIAIIQMNVGVYRITVKRYENTILLRDQVQNQKFFAGPSHWLS